MDEKKSQRPGDTARERSEEISRGRGSQRSVGTGHEEEVDSSMQGGRAQKSSAETPEQGRKGDRKGNGSG